MKLSYACGLDPSKMPTLQGKKFCESCQKQVHDLRRKSDEKIALFYKENPTACVIAYEDQLEKLPAKPHEQTARNYFPYAAAVVSIALLPSLTIAQQNMRAEAPPTTIVPLLVPDLSAPAAVQAQNNTKTFTKYYIKGKVKLHDKKYRTRAGREIAFYIARHDSNGNFIGNDTIATGKVGLTGTFRLKTTKEYFGMIQDSTSDMNVHVKGLSNSTFRKMKIEGNKVSGVVHVRRRIRWMGKF